MLEVLFALNLAASSPIVITQLITGEENLVAQSGTRLTTDRYLRLQQKVRDENPIDNQKPYVTYGDFASILGFPGKLTYNSGGNETYRWEDGNRAVEGVFRNSVMIRWKGIGF